MHVLSLLWYCVLLLFILFLLFYLISVRSLMGRLFCVCSMVWQRGKRNLVLRRLYRRQIEGENFFFCSSLIFTSVLIILGCFRRNLEFRRKERICLCSLFSALIYLLFFFSFFFCNLLCWFSIFVTLCVRFFFLLDTDFRKTSIKVMFLIFEII